MGKRFLALRPRPSSGSTPCPRASKQDGHPAGSTGPAARLRSTAQGTASTQSGGLGDPRGVRVGPWGDLPPRPAPPARSPSVLRAKARPTWLAGSSSSLLAEGPSAFSSLAFFCSAFPAEAVAAGGLPLAGLQPPPCGARAQGGCRSAEGSTTAGRGATAASEQGPLDAHTAAGPLPTGAKAPLGPASKVGAGLLVAKSQDRQEAADLRVYFPTFSTGQLR